MIEQGLYQHLKSASAMTAPVLSVRRGTNDPAVVYNVISDNRQQSISGKDGITVTRFQIDCYGSRYSVVKQLETAVTESLHNHTGTLGGQPCQRVRLETRRNDFETNAELFRIILQFVIYHHS